MDSIEAYSIILEEKLEPSWDSREYVSFYPFRSGPFTYAYTQNGGSCELHRARLHQMINEPLYLNIQAEYASETMIVIVPVDISSSSSTTRGMANLFNGEFAIAEYASWFSLIPDSIYRILFVEVDDIMAQDDEKWRQKVKDTILKTGIEVLYNGVPDIIDIESVLNPHEYILDNAVSESPFRQHCGERNNMMQMRPTCSQDKAPKIKEDRRNVMRRIWEYVMTCETGARMSYLNYDEKQLEDFSCGYLTASKDVMRRAQKFRQVVNDKYPSLGENYRIFTLFDMYKKEMSKEKWFERDIETIEFLTNFDKCVEVWFESLYSKVTRAKVGKARSEDGHAIPRVAKSLREASAEFGINAMMHAVIEKKISPKDVVIPVTNEYVIISDSDGKIGSELVNWEESEKKPLGMFLSEYVDDATPRKTMDLGKYIA